MVSIGISSRQSSRFVYVLYSLAAHHVPRLLATGGNNALVKRDGNQAPVGFIILIPVLVLLSGLFAGLTLGYMSLDETQLNVLSMSGTPKQREYASKIIPIRKNGHLLLVTLLLSNMIVNETLPVITEPVLGGGAQSIVVSTVLIVIFSEIIPQSLFTRHGLYLGAKMAWFTLILIYLMGIVAWPVAKLLELVLGPHHGIIYRRAELKELIAMHSSHATHGGDLKTDTVTIIGATLDLQEKVVRQAMTPIQDVFMLSIDSRLDYELLKKICLTGHSRVPVYEEVEVPLPADGNSLLTESPARGRPRTQRVKKIVGILLVKHCLLLDPKDAIPLRKLPLNRVPFVPQNESLLGILDKFQEGRSHMAIVSRFSIEKAQSVKKAVKRGLTQRLRERVGIADSDSSDEEEKEKPHEKKTRWKRKIKDIEEAIEEEESPTDSPKVPEVLEKDFAHRKSDKLEIPASEQAPKSRRASFQLPRAAAGMASMSTLEQSMPADAVLTKEGAEEFLQGIDPAVHPLGIITLEDVLEELIGEEIYDEFDSQGAHGDPYVPPPVATGLEVEMFPTNSTDATLTVVDASHSNRTTPVLKPLALKGLGFLRSRSAPPTPRDANKSMANNLATAEVPPVITIQDSAGGTIAESLSYSYSTDTDVLPPSTPSVLKPKLIIGGEDPTDDKAVKSSSTAITPVPTPTNTHFPHVIPMTAPTSRSASPAPSLEAILLDRKRRTQAQGGATPILSPVPVPSMSVARSTGGSSTKGGRFKSSPLVGERTGQVVAEAILDRLNSVVESDVKGSNDSRIPDGKDKVGPDKEDD